MERASALRKVNNLSVVSGAYSTSIVTQASTPLLDSDGNPVGNQTIAGAVTIGLTGDQAKLARWTRAVCGLRVERRVRR